MYKTSNLLMIAAAKILFWSGMVLWTLTVIALIRFFGQAAPTAFGWFDNFLGQLIEEMYLYGVWWVLLSGIAGIAYGTLSPEKLDTKARTFFVVAGASMVISIPTGMLIIGYWA